jgi:hypothetical protein
MCQAVVDLAQHATDQIVVSYVNRADLYGTHGLELTRWGGVARDSSTRLGEYPDMTRDSGAEVPVRGRRHKLKPAEIASS